MSQAQTEKNIHVSFFLKILIFIFPFKILFNVSKKEYGNPNSTFKKIIKKYKPIYKVIKKQ